MQARFALKTTLTCVTLVLVASCSSTSSGTPTPTTSSSVAQNEKSLPYAGAPGVATPLDSSKIDQDPCSVATPAQISSISGGILKNSSKFDAGAGSVDCAWVLADGLGRLTTGVAMETNAGLSSIYDKNVKKQLTSFKAIPAIDGHPGVAFANGGEASTVCNVAVGLSDSRIYLAIANLGPRNPKADNPCGIATDLAELAVQHLKGA
jgi:hypothetical protein